MGYYGGEVARQSLWIRRATSWLHATLTACGVCPSRIPTPVEDTQPVTYLPLAFQKLLQFRS